MRLQRVLPIGLCGLLVATALLGGSQLPTVSPGDTPGPVQVGSGTGDRAEGSHPGEIAAENVQSTVVDMHGHTFNLNYLPVQGILMSRGVSRPLAKLMAQALLDATAPYGDWDSQEGPKDPLLREDRLESLSRGDLLREIWRRIRASGKAGERLAGAAGQRRITRHLARVVHFAETEQARGVSDELQETILREAGGRYGVTAMSQGARDQDSIKESLRGREENLSLLLQWDLQARGSADGFLRMLLVLMSSDEDLVWYLRHREHPDADYFVHHMMDLDTVYRGVSSLNPLKQLERARKVREGPAGGSRLLSFVAFDPFRHVEDPGFQVLETAIGQDVVGLKFYPPSGYRPVNNEIPRKPGCWRMGKRHKAIWYPITARIAVNRQHRSRYGKLGKKRTIELWRGKFRDALGKSDLEIDGLRGRPEKVLDWINEVFFDWAASNDMPVFSHQTPGGFQAMSGYGEAMANPCYWGNVAQNAIRRAKDAVERGEEGKPLKIILGHAGGHEKGRGWFSATDKEWRSSFAFQAYKLCVLFEDVFCDFGYANEILSQEQLDSGVRDPAKDFGQRLAALAARPVVAAQTDRMDHIDFCDAEEQRRDFEPVFDIRRKILYGSDWMMVMRADGQRNLISSFDEVFENATDPSGNHNLRDWKDEFFGGNAVRLLGAENFQ